MTKKKGEGLQVVGFFTDKKGRTRPITKRKGETIRRETVFGPARYEKYAKIVSLKSPESAEVSVEELGEEYEDAKTRAKKLRILRVLVLAANRAGVMAGNKRLSKKERAEAKRIQRIYRDAYEELAK